MSPSSNTSSPYPQNGSAYAHSHPDFTSQESYPDSTHPTDYLTEAPYTFGDLYNDSPATSTQPTQDTRANTNDYHYQNDHHYQNSYGYSAGKPYTNGDYSQSASTSNISSSSDQQQQPQLDREGYQQYRQYYLPATAYPQETPNYELELAIDSIEDEHHTSHHSDHPGRENDRDQSPQPSTPPRTQPTPQPENIARSPTARRWSREYSPEERMRVGLPRWETEQHRLNYERRQRQAHRRS